MKVPFQDLFSVSLPRHKRLSELERDKAVYLPSGILMDELYNCINNKNSIEIPRDILDSILVVEFQRYDKMIDINGEEYDWSAADEPFSPQSAEVNGTIVEDLLYFEKKLSAVNNIFLNDIIDIEASVIYNLLEIRPKTEEVSLDYLRYYFWQIPWCTPTGSHGDSKCDECEHNMGTSCDIQPFGNQLINLLRDRSHDIIWEQEGDERFCLIPEAFQELTMEIDDQVKRDELVEGHRRYLDEQSRKTGKDALQAMFGSPLYEELKELENRVYSVLLPDEKRYDKGKYTGFVRLLEDAMTRFNEAENSDCNGTAEISQAAIMGVKSACEIILNAKLRVLNLPDWNKSSSFFNNVEFIKGHKHMTFSRWLSPKEMGDFFDGLNMVRANKNKGSHTTEFIRIREAKELIDIACNTVIRGLVEYIR